MYLVSLWLSLCHRLSTQVDCSVSHVLFLQERAYLEQTLIFVSIYQSFDHNLFDLLENDSGYLIIGIGMLRLRFFFEASILNALMSLPFDCAFCS